MKTLVIGVAGSSDLVTLLEADEHCMKPQMLQSQFETLEGRAGTLTCDVAMLVKDLLNESLRHL